VSLTAGKSVIDGRTWMNLDFAHSIKDQSWSSVRQSSITAAIQYKSPPSGGLRGWLAALTELLDRYSSLIINNRFHGIKFH
jgi:hypothetical protein